MKPTHYDPQYIQITKKEAATILGISVSELDRRRKFDLRCPSGFKDRDAAMAPVRFRLSDIYAYSEAIMNDSIPARLSDESDSDLDLPTSNLTQ